MAAPDPELLLPDGRPLRVITVRHPWAWCIFHGKGTENRAGRGLWKYRGALAIYAASSGWSKRGQHAPHVIEAWWRASLEAGYPWCTNHPMPLGGRYIEGPEWVPGTGILTHPTVYYDGDTRQVPAVSQFHLGAVLGVVDLTDVHWASSTECSCDGPWAEQSYEEAGGAVRTDVMHLDLANPVEFARPLYTTSVKGGLGLRRPSPALVEEVADALAAVADDGEVGDDLAGVCPADPDGQHHIGCGCDQ